jgi:hypothetical protein
MRRKRTVTATTLAALFTFSAKCGVAHADWLLALYSGTSYTRHSDLRLIQDASDSDATFEEVHWRARPFEDAPYYGLRVSWLNQGGRTGAAFEFTHYKMYARVGDVTRVRGRWNGAPVNEAAPISQRVQDLEISHGVNLGALDVQYRWRASEASGWFPHAGVGLAGYWPHAEGTLHGVPSSAGYRLSGGGGQLFGGAEYRINRRLGFMIESKFDAGSLDIELSPSARLKTRTRTLHAVAGLIFHF